MYWLYFHIICVMSYFGTLVGSHLLLIGKVNQEVAQRLLKIEKILLASLGLSALSGGLLLFLSGKSVSFYMQNGATHAKLTLFVLILAAALVNLGKIANFARTFETQADVSKPKIAVMLQRIQLLGLFLLPLLGIAMARGSF